MLDAAQLAGDVLAEARAANDDQPWSDALRERAARNRERLRRRVTAHGRPPAEAPQLDALERYVGALEDLVAELAPGAPLLRGTWRPKGYHSRAWGVQAFRCSVRQFKDAAIALRNWSADRAREGIEDA